MREIPFLTVKKDYVKSVMKKKMLNIFTLEKILTDIEMNVNYVKN